MDTTTQFCVLRGGAIGLATIFGTYLARMITFEMRPLEKTLAKVEQGFYRDIWINSTKQMSWKEYFFALFLTNLMVVAFVVLNLTLQNSVQSEEGKEGLSFDLVFHTVISLNAFAFGQSLAELSKS